MCVCDYQAPIDDDHIWDIVNCMNIPKPRLCPSGMYLDPEDQECLYYPQECPSPYTWDNETGDCICDSENEASPAYNSRQGCRITEVWNQARCECMICPPQQCPPVNGYPYFWNPNCCSCTCVPRECDDGESWDFETCTCVWVPV